MTPRLGICTNTKHRLPSPKHPFSWPELESGQNKLHSEQNGPQQGKMSKMSERWAKFFLKWAKKLFICESLAMKIWEDPRCQAKGVNFNVSECSGILLGSTGHTTARSRGAAHHLFNHKSPLHKFHHSWY